MIELIPAIDLIDGKCVRLTQGNYSEKKIYNEDPIEVARMFDETGIKRLHLVDLDGAKAQHIVNYKILEKITSKTRLIVDFGGGLKSDDDLKIAFECGAAMITGGSIAVKKPEIFRDWIEKYGNEKIILGADVKEEKISVTGWTETTDLELIPFLNDYSVHGIKKVICTDISKDGMLEGPAFSLYEKILSNFPDLFLIASGGVSSMQDIENLQNRNIPAVIFGKVFYEGRLTLKDISRFLSKN